MGDFANTDVGEAVASAGKDIAIAGATGIKNKIIEKITNATATNDAKKASQDLSNYVAQSMLIDPVGFRTNPNFVQEKLNEVISPEYAQVSSQTTSQAPSQPSKL